MTSYKVEAFKHTGFSPNNIPDSAATLRALFPDISVYPNINILQDRGVTSIRIESNWESAKNIDYVCIGGNNYYIVVNHIMINPKVTELHLAMDYLTTLGLDNIEIVSGWCTRRHVTLDPMFGNTMEEPFAPQQAMVIDMGEKIEPRTTEFKNLVCCTVDLETFNFDADTYKDTVNSNFVVVPKVPPAATATEIYFNAGVERYKFTMPQVTIYDIDYPAVQEKLQSLRSLGIESAIVATYKVPNGFAVAAYAGGEGRLVSLGSNFITREITSLPFEYAEVKNAKALSGQYNRYRLYSVTSGDAAEYRADEIFEYGKTNPSVVMFADAQPTGKPYCRPKSYKGNTEDVFIEMVSGAPWQNFQIAFNTVSGQAFIDQQQNRKRFEQTTRAVNQVGNAIGSIVSGIKDPGAAIGAATNIVTNGANLAAEVNNSEQDYQNAQNVIIPDIRFPISYNLQNYLNNAFWMARVRLSDSDIIRFDAFLTQFGYAVSEPLKDEHFKGRVHFNYVRAQSVNLKMKEGKPFDMMSRIGAIRQIEAGVRVWHTAPDIASMYDNPIG